MYLPESLVKELRSKTKIRLTYGEITVKSLSAIIRELVMIGYKVRKNERE